MDKNVMEAMEKVRKSGVCNMYDGVCVRGALRDQHGIYINRNEFRQVFNDFVEYKEKENEEERPESEFYIQYSCEIDEWELYLIDGGEFGDELIMGFETKAEAELFLEEIEEEK